MSTPIGRAAALALGLVLATAAGPEGDGLAPVNSCLERNIPKRTSEQVVEFTAVDRVGGQRKSRARIMAKRFDDSRRKVVMRFSKPLDMRGSALLIEETERGANDMFLYTPELRKVKRVNANGAGGSVFGTDFSYEDFERWQLVNKPGEQVRKPDAELGGRPVYVIESNPVAETGSSYEVIVSYIDHETCVVLKSEHYETGRRLRKVLTASPEDVIEENGIHVATEVRMEDLRDETHTAVTVEDLEVDREIQDAEFNPSRLARRR